MSNESKVRIVNKTGNPRDTEVYLGEIPIDGITKVDISGIDANDSHAVTVKLEIVSADIDMNSALDDESKDKIIKYLTGNCENQNS